MTEGGSTNRALQSGERIKNYWGGQAPEKKGVRKKTNKKKKKKTQQKKKMDETSRSAQQPSLPGLTRAGTGRSRGIKGTISGASRRGSQT